jgi:hypothetical protein
LRCTNGAISPGAFNSLKRPATASRSFGRMKSSRLRPTSCSADPVPSKLHAVALANTIRVSQTMTIASPEISSKPR